MHKLLILFLALVALFFVFQIVKKPVVSSVDVAGTTGPGYIPAFQGHPQIGVRT
jgi:hypothetical protein